MKMPLRVYLASPYGHRAGLSIGQCEENVQRAIAIARQLILLGHIPFVPLLYHYLHAGWADSPSEDVWRDICISWLYCCDAMLRMPGISLGADEEVKLAEFLGIPVCHSLEELNARA